MKSRRKMMKTSSNLGQISEFKFMPPEVWTQILATLPVKTLLRFRCVCKSWCTIIDDPDFMSMHVKLCNINSDHNNLLALEWLGRYGYKGSLLTVRQADTLRKTAHIFKTCHTYLFSGKCNGLLLMIRCVSYIGSELRLLNPSIRKTLLIPPCPLPPSWNGEVLKVLGFAPCSRDYKVVVISFERSDGIEPTKMSVAVYTLSDQQWTVRNNGLNISCQYFKRMFGQYYFPSRAFYFEGAAHWFGKHPSGDSNLGDNPTHLVSLDFDTEIFTFLELPYASDERKTFRFLFLFGESLAIFSVSSVSASIWVLKQDNGKGVWTLWFSGPSNCDGFELFRWCVYALVFYHESDDGSCFSFGKKSYNINTCQVRELGKSMSRYVDLETYTESLVLCNGYRAEDITALP